MRRVSSRQRLVSWDAFDATTNKENDGSLEGEYCVAPSSFASVVSPLVSSRKRERSQNASSPAELTRETTCMALALVLDTSPAIPAFSWELVSQQDLYLDDLPVDVHIHICSFLDMQGLRSVMGLNHNCRHLLFSADAHSLWMQKCRSVWEGLLPSSKHRFVDQLNLPTAAGGFAKHNVNLHLLISMTPSNLPTKVDESMLGTGRRTRRTIHRLRQERLVRVSEQQNLYEAELLAYNDKKDGKRFIRYTGLVGSGDRCIRSNHPLPRPQRKDSIDREKGMRKIQPSLFDLLCRGSNAVKVICLNNWRPFVSPYVDSDHSIQVSPRMVAYFEVSITEDKTKEPEAPSSLRSEEKRECVAVGIATESFSCKTKMPGWDNQSFGYHGDDGGTFHASGGMVERFGPCFGSGDTVGCGIDYISRGIFFTLNGNFLGYGWKQIDVEFLENNLYGVIGIDTNDPVSVNYGKNPFQFDLTNFTMKHEGLITPHYQHSAHKHALDELPSYPEI
jgi:hypothetical protein